MDTKTPALDPYLKQRITELNPILEKIKGTPEHAALLGFIGDMDDIIYSYRHALKQKEYLVFSCAIADPENLDSEPALCPEETQGICTNIYADKLNSKPYRHCAECWRSHAKNWAEKELETNPPTLSNWQFV